MLTRLLIDRVGNMALGDQRQRLDPLQRRAFPLGEDRSFTPGIQQMHPLVILAELAGIRGVHHEAIGAAVDLRGSDFDEFEKRAFEAALIDVSLQSRHRLKCGGADFHGVQSLLHVDLPVFWHIETPARKRSNTGFAAIYRQPRRISGAKPRLSDYCRI